MVEQIFELWNDERNFKGILEWQFSKIPLHGPTPKRHEKIAMQSTIKTQKKTISGLRK